MPRQPPTSGPAARSAGRRFLGRRRWAMRATILPVVLFGFPGLVAAQPDPKPEAKGLVTRVYDLKPVLAGKTVAADTDAVIKLIFESVALGDVKPGGGGPQLVERDGQ